MTGTEGYYGIMADPLPRPVQRLVKVLGKLPGVGSKTAMRYALFLVREGEEAILEMADSLAATVEEVGLCEACGSMAPKGACCSLCTDPTRDSGLLCVVESIADLIAVEATRLYPGRYFVLHRLLSPLKGVGPEQIGVDRLVSLLEDRGVREVVLATPLTTDGETTANYLTRRLAQTDVIVSRLAAGIPVGGSLEYLDRMTLSRAFQDRK